MVDEVQRVRETTTQSGDTVQKTTEVSDPGRAREHQEGLAERIVWYITGAVSVLLVFRFVLSLLGANTTNGFADFIYSLSHVFVAPFFSLFSYNNVVYGTSRFEIYTLVALAFYVVLGWGIARLVTIGRD